MNKKNEKVGVEKKAPEVKYKYLCSACSDTAIETSNKMLGVKVNCKNCDTLISVNDVTRYIKI